MDKRETVEYALAAAKKAGADKAQALVTYSEKTELNVDAGRMSLLRTTGNVTLSVTAFRGGRKGAVTINKIDAASIDEAARNALALAATSEADDANDIAPAGAKREFDSGDSEPDLGAMYDRMAEFLAHAGAKHPIVKLEQCILDFTRNEKVFGNTNGAAFVDRLGAYEFTVMFTSKDGDKASSFNYSGGVFRKLDKPLAEWGALDELMRQSAEQTETDTVDGKFIGDLVITPHCMPEITEALKYVYLGNGTLIAGTSPWKDALGTRVASESFTLRSVPNSDRVHVADRFTADGFEAKDAAIIEKGVLKSFQLNLYGANKTGKPRAANSGDALVIDPGAEALASIIAGVERGILLCRFSGGQPSDNGDFSGVAKNSYLIEKGKIVRPISETMVAGNFTALLKNAIAVSKETVDFGHSSFPWIRFGGVTISGK